MIYVHTPSFSASPARPIAPKAKENFQLAATLFLCVLVHKYYRNGRYVLLQDLIDTSFYDRKSGSTIVAPAQLRALAMLSLLTAVNLYFYQISLNLINFYKLKKKTFFFALLP
jgi:hypothetical protein